jgi:hypothetical protein
MSALVLYVLGTSAGTTYQFALDAANPVVASAIALNTAALALSVSDDLTLLKSENPTWTNGSSTATWVGGGFSGAFYMVRTSLYVGGLANQRYRVRLVLVDSSGVTSLAVFAGVANSTVTFPPNPRPYVFDGASLYARVPVTGTYTAGRHQTGVLILQTNGAVALQAGTASADDPDSCLVVKVGSETLLATEFIAEAPV